MEMNCKETTLSAKVIVIQNFVFKGVKVGEECGLRISDARNNHHRVHSFEKIKGNDLYTLDIVALMEMNCKETTLSAEVTVIQNFVFKGVKVGEECGYQ